jgi:hypothetical protein
MLAATHRDVIGLAVCILTTTTSAATIKALAASVFVALFALRTIFTWGI